MKKRLLAIGAMGIWVILLLGEPGMYTATGGEGGNAVPIRKYER